MSSDETSGWSWAAFIMGPFWYLSKGMVPKGTWLLSLCILTVFMAVPVVLIYCGAKGKRDWYTWRLKAKSKVDFEKL